MADTISLGSYPFTIYRLEGERHAEALADLPTQDFHFPHLLPRTPDGCDAYIECTIAELGYAVGDRVYVATHTASNRDSAIEVSFDDHDVHIQGSPATQLALTELPQREGSIGSPSAITPADWNLVVIPYVNVRQDESPP